MYIYIYINYSYFYLVWWVNILWFKLASTVKIHWDLTDGKHIDPTDEIPNAIECYNTVSVLWILTENNKLFIYYVVENRVIKFNPD